MDRAITLYSDTVCKVCTSHLKSYADTEDIFQTTFLKYVLYSGSFENNEHEKAWTIRMTINACKDYLKSFFRSYIVPLGEITGMTEEMPKKYSEVLEAVLSFPKKYKNVVYLFYYEDYMAVGISETLGRSANTVYTLFARARVMLREMPGGGDFG